MHTAEHGTQDRNAGGEAGRPATPPPGPGADMKLLAAPELLP